MTTKPDYIRQSLHAIDLDDDGHDIHGVVPVIGYAECNTTPTTDSTPNSYTGVPWDTFYDVDGVAGSLPAGLALTDAGFGNLTATEDGVWVFDLGVIPAISPGSAGFVLMNTPDYGFGPRVYIRAASNDPVLTASRTVRMRSGETLQVIQQNAGSSVNQINGYALLAIIRIARSVS